MRRSRQTLWALRSCIQFCSYKGQRYGLDLKILYFSGYGIGVVVSIFFFIAPSRRSAPRPLVFLIISERKNLRVLMESEVGLTCELECRDRNKALRF